MYTEPSIVARLRQMADSETCPAAATMLDLYTNLGEFSS